MKYEDLKQGTKVQMNHHFNRTCGTFIWTHGKVKVLENNEKIFEPNYTLYPSLMILPHRMNEIKESNCSHHPMDRDIDNDENLICSICYEILETAQERYETNWLAKDYEHNYPQF